MSTWTSEGVRRGLAAAIGAVALGLSACLAGDLHEAAPTLAVARGTVVVAGPPGYCVDPVVTRDRPNGAFVLLGSCAALTGAGPAPERTAALTAAVSPAGTAPPVARSAPALAAYLETGPGLALLSRNGDGASVEILAAEARDGVLFLRLRDTGPFEGAEVAPTYWRAILDIGAHAVSLSVLSLADRPLSQAQGRGLLEDFIAATRDATEAARPDPGRAGAAPPARP